MSDITLTTGIRQNLLALQQTASDLNTTQEALATGKKVNSAADNPSSYFTSQNLTQTANSLSALLDQIGQGSSTIQQATNGLTSLTGLLQQALSTAQQAQSSNWTAPAAATAAVNLASFTNGQVAGTTNLATVIPGSATGTTSVSTLTAANVLNITVGTGVFNISLTSGEALTAIESAINTATSGAVTATDDGSGHLILNTGSGTSSFTVAADPSFGLAAATKTASLDTTAATSLTQNSLVIGIGSNTYTVSITASSSLSTIEADINSATGLAGAVTATDDGSGHLLIKSTSGTPDFTVAADSSLGIAAGGAAGTFNTSSASSLAAGSLLIDVGSSTYTISISASSSLAQIEADINSTTGLGSAGSVSATDDGSGHLVLVSNNAPIGFTVDANATSAALGLTASSTANNVVIGQSSTRSTLQSNFNGLLTQINQLASDSGYNGINLLAGDSLTIDFNPTGTSTLTITGVTFNAAGLGLTALSGSGSTSFQSDQQLANVVASINAALSAVQTQTETFGTNASTISTRQSFETALINTLQTGATNLVVADQNQESADLLTEQTQQQLEISALSIANQANQGVLKLFS
jgi:flagellin